MIRMNSKKENFIFGIRPVVEAIKSGKEIERILLQKNLRGESFRELFNLIRELEIPFQFAPIEKFNRLSKQNYQGVIAWVTEITYQKIENILPAIYEEGRIPLVLILDNVISTVYSDLMKLRGLQRVIIGIFFIVMVMPECISL